MSIRNVEMRFRLGALIDGISIRYRETSGHNALQFCEEIAILLTLVLTCILVVLAIMISCKQSMETLKYQLVLQNIVKNGIFV